MCWSGEQAGEHLPLKHWDRVLDAMITETGVMEVLISKAPKASLTKKRKMREAYRKNFCVGVPELMEKDIVPPTPTRLRQCAKDLAHDVYTEKQSTDSFSAEDRTRLHIFNKLSSMPAQHKLKDPLSMSDAMHPENANVRKQVRWYCEEVLDILAR
jgi:hypothetical protein